MDKTQIGLGWVFVVAGALATVLVLVAAVWAAFKAVWGTPKEVGAETLGVGDLLKELIGKPVGLAFVIGMLTQAFGWAMLRGGEALQIVTFPKVGW